MVAVSSSAADRTPLIGVWKLLSYQTEFQDGSPNRAIFGEHPLRYIIFTSEGRMMALIQADGRKVASSDADRAALLSSVIAYSGKYRMNGNGSITHRGCGVESRLGWHRSSAQLCTNRRSPDGHGDVAAGHQCVRLADGSWCFGIRAGEIANAVERLAWRRRIPRRLCVGSDSRSCSSIM